MHSRQFPKALKWLLILGLLITLLSLLIPKKLWTWILLGKYRRLSRLVYAQAMHETGNGTSWLARKYRNYFGMKTAIHRKQLGSPGLLNMGGYQQYRSFGQSVRDFKLWLEYNNFPTDVATPYNYVKELKERSYFEDTMQNYLKGIQRFL